MTDISNQVQERYWKSYDAIGRGGKHLFNSIDTDGNILISVGELQTFLHPLHKDSVDDHRFDYLMSLASDDEFDS